MIATSISVSLLLFALYNMHINALQAAGKNRAFSGAKVLCWDGVVADTTSWRIRQGIDAAFSVWPKLKIGQEDTVSQKWLENKMIAIAPYLCGNGSKSSYGTTSRSVEFALLARLLIEEQKLDPSVGKTGKYASQYHPQGERKSIAIPSVRQTRPLTVGEIQANWREQLLDTALVRYAIKNESGRKENPIPALHQCILEQQENLTILPLLQVDIANALVNSQPSSLVLTISHESELSIAEKTLAQDSRLKSLSLRLLVGSDISVLENMENELELYLGSNWGALQEIHQCYSQNRSIHPEFALASWTTSIDQQNQATMNPSFSVMTPDNLAERLSSGISQSS